MARRKNNGRWQGRYYDRDGKQFAQTFDTKREAAAWEASRKTDLNRGTHLDPRKGEVTVRAYAEEWLAAQTLRPGSSGVYESHLRLHIIPAFGSKRLTDVRPTAVRAFVKHLNEILAPSTVVTVHGLLSMVFKGAVQDGFLATSPCHKTAPRTPPKRRVVPLTREQVAAISAALPPRLQAIAYVGAGLGLRSGEALGLTVDRVQFLQRRVLVHEQLQTRPSGVTELCPPKTRASDRTVPLPSFVGDRLSAHIADFPAGRWGLIFTTAQGAPYGRSQFGRVWRAAVASAGLPKGTRFHDLRHTYASLLIEQGEHPKVIQERLGHATITETMDTYGKLFPAAEEGTRGAIDRAFLDPHEDAGRTETGPYGV